MKLRRASTWAAMLLLLCGTGGTAFAEDTAGEADVTDPFAGRDDLVPEGRTLFNVHCAHCHGPDAFQGERPRDLRRLLLRYGKDMPIVFYRTATMGRADKGMPSWKGALADEDLWKIFTFLRSVQK